MGKSVAVAGKGGTGKSTIAALLVLSFAKRGMGPILAVDADPDANLGTLLGMEPRTSVGELREDFLKEIKDFPAGMSKASYLETELHQIIEEGEGFDLITMGRGEGPGCYCYLNSLIRKFSADLNPAYPWIVVDNEAGLEHISRRTTDDVDSLIVVVNDNPLSFHAAQRIQEITEQLKNRVTGKYAVSNMVRESRRSDVRQKIDGLGLEFLCDIPYDAAMEELVYNGQPLGTLNGTPIQDCIDIITDRIGGSDAAT